MLVFALIIFFVLMFFVFVFISRRIIDRNIGSAVKHLDQINQDYIRKEEEANKKLEEAERTYQETVSKAKEEALVTRQEMLKQAEQEKENIIQTAKANAQDIVQQAEKTRHLLISELEKRIDTESVKKASNLIGQVLPGDLRSQIHLQLVRDFIDKGLDKLEGLDVPSDLKEIKVVSSFSLDKKEKDKLAKVFKEKIKKEINLTEEINPDLVAGFMVVLGSLVIDGSLQFKISEKAKNLIGRE